MIGPFPSLVKPLQSLAIVGLVVSQLAGCGGAEVIEEAKEKTAEVADAGKAAKDKAAKELEAAKKAAMDKKPALPKTGIEVWTLPEGAHEALLKPELANEKAPDKFKAKFTTSKGDFVVEVHRDWAPNGADRFYNLVNIGFYEKTMFFRNIDKFMVQWGISGYPEVSRVWRAAKIQDDPVKETNSRGRITFATAGPNTRTTQLFINHKNNANLDKTFAPFGEVIEGMDVVDKLYNGYGEGPPRGKGPNQGRLQSQGGAYLAADFPKLDGFERVEIVK